MNITIIGPPPFEPVSLAEVYKQLRLTPDHAGSPGEVSHPDDDALSRHIETARKFVEQTTRRSLIQQTVRLSSSAWPRYCYGWAPYFRAGMVERILLRRVPIIRVEAVSFYDGSNALQTVQSSDYYLTDEQVPELRFISGFATPTAYERPDAVRVDYVAGYAPGASPTNTQEDYAANVPGGLKDAVLIGVQLLYDNLSESDRTAMEKMRESILQPFRIQNL